MKPLSFFYSAALMLLMAAGAGASTLVDLVCWAQILDVGHYDEDAGTLDLLVCVEGVDMDASATDYFADSFLEYECNREQWIVLEGISPETVDMIRDGHLVDMNYHNVSCILIGEDGEPEAYCSTEWNFIGLSEPCQDLPQDACLSMNR